MTNRNACPDPLLLRAYLLGTTDDKQAARLERHLPGCPACRSRLPLVPEEDELVELLRKVGGKQRPRNPVVADLVEKLRRLPNAAAPPPLPPLRSRRSRGRLLATSTAGVLLVLVLLLGSGPALQQVGLLAAPEPAPEKLADVRPSPPAETPILELPPVDLSVARQPAPPVRAVTLLEFRSDHELAVATASSPAVHFDLREGRTTPAPFRGRYHQLSPDGTLSVYHTPTYLQVHRAGLPEPARTLSGHVGLSETLAWTDDGRTLVGWDGQTRELLCWDMAALRLDRRVAVDPGPGEPYTGFALSPDGRVAALTRTGSAGGLVFVEVESGRVLRDDDLVRVAGVPSWSPDGQSLAVVESSAAGAGLQLVDVAGTRVRTTLSDARGGVAWSPDGSRLAVATADGRFRILATATGRVEEDIPAHHEDMTAIAWSPDGTLLATGGPDGLVRLWDTATWEPRGSLTLP